jgi:hypothetical protein
MDVGTFAIMHARPSFFPDTDYQPKRILVFGFDLA